MNNALLARSKSKTPLWVSTFDKFIFQTSWHCKLTEMNTILILIYQLCPQNNQGRQWHTATVLYFGWNGIFLQVYFFYLSQHSNSAFYMLTILLMLRKTFNFSFIKICSSRFSGKYIRAWPRSILIRRKMTGRDKVTYFSLSTKYQPIFSLYLEYFGSANICHIKGNIFL